MRCPKCEQQLVAGLLRCYETLEEHVFDSNQLIVLRRPTFVCPDACLGQEQFFDPDGYAYNNAADSGNYTIALDSVAQEIEEAF